MTPVRVGVLCDYLEEGWPSMDLTAAMLLDRLRAEHPEVDATPVRPPYRRRLTRLPVVGRHPAARNADRLANRFGDFPRHVAPMVRRVEFDVYHLIDHSYSQLVHGLPAGRTVVTCHDLDTFRCLLDPAGEPRPAWFRAMARRTLDGFRKASAVACNSASTRDAVLAHGLHPPERLRVVPMGVHPDCSPEPDPPADAEAARYLGEVGSGGDAPVDLLHVGTTVPRKRVDVLLDVFAGVRRSLPTARLVKAGGALTDDQERRARELGVAGALVRLPFLPAPTLAAVYRRAALVLQPSEAEGFGLPAAEALACGAPLLASDLPALREVAGDAATYRPVGDVPGWVAAALILLAERHDSPGTRSARRAAGLTRARSFSWSAHADRLAEIYGELARGPGRNSPR